MRQAHAGDTDGIVRVVIEAGLFPEEAADFVRDMMGSYFAEGQGTAHRCVMEDQEDDLVGASYVRPVRCHSRLLRQDRLRRGSACP